MGLMQQILDHIGFEPALNECELIQIHHMIKIRSTDVLFSINGFDTNAPHERRNMFSTHFMFILNELLILISRYSDGLKFESSGNSTSKHILKLPDWAL